MQVIFIALAALSAYLLGSIPFGVLISRLARGVDIRREGTHNIGASNVLFVAGPGAGFIVLVLDVLKGALAAYIARVFIGTPSAIALAGLFAIIGHDWPVFLGFKGGKGVATTAGVLCVIDVRLYLFSLLLWLLFVLIIRYWVVATMLVYCFLPVLMWLTFKSGSYIMFAVFLAGITIFKHGDDLTRIYLGQEPTAAEWLSRLKKKA